MAKKKTNKAKAAAARRELTPEEQRRVDAKRHSKEVRDNVKAAQKEASEQRGSRLVMIAVVAVLLIAVALVFTFLPGMLMGKA